MIASGQLENNGGSQKTPGDAILEELEKRGWSQSDLARIVERPLNAINETVLGKRGITPELAVALAAAFNNSPEFWMNLEGGYRVSLLDPNTEVERRAKIFSVAPIKEMEKRGWIKETGSLNNLEKELCKFFHVDSLADKPKIHVNARQSLKTDSLSPSQVAWCVRAGNIASFIDAKSFKANTFKDALPELRKLTDFPEKTKHLPKFLSEIGVRLVVVEPLPQTRIDGAAFWLADDAPVIVLSMRYDRIDCLWFTLAHECSHIRHNDAQSVDVDLVGDFSREHVESDLEQRRKMILADVDQLKRDVDAYNDGIEARANREAASLLIPPDKLKSFVIRVKPFYSKERIIQFAHRMQVHPGIVTGQLQHIREIGWNANKEMLAKVRDHLTATALTDGWGKTVKQTN